MKRFLFLESAGNGEVIVYAHDQEHAMEELADVVRHPNNFRLIKEPKPETSTVFNFIEA